MKQVEVTILGQSYLLACPEGGEQLLQAAVASVDREMSGIRDAGKVKARERIAVLAALNLAYRLAEAPRAAPAPALEAGDPKPTAEDAAAGEARRAAALQVESLIARLDTALNDDGRLL
jgi:cell division protein ZapA